MQYSRYGGTDHVGALPFFEAEATAFLRSRFAGEPPPENCADVGPRNGLELLPVPPLPRVLTGRVRRTSTGYAIPACIDASLGETLAVNLYVVRGGKRRRVATLRPPGTLTARTRPLAVPLRRGRPGRWYVVVVSAIADGERVAATRSFRAGTR